jgi:hypothetical protein
MSNPLRPVFSRLSELVPEPTEWLWHMRMAYRTVERAKEMLGVVSERQGWGPESVCYWRLPAEAVELDDTHSTPRANVALYEPTDVPEGGIKP